LLELEDRVVPALLGQELFPVNNPWNQNISNAPVASNSAAIISHIGPSVRLHPDWGADNAANGDSPLYGIPVNIVHGNSTAKVNVSIDNYPGESDITPVPIPANAVIEGDYQNGPNPNGGGYNSGQRGDSHLIIWDEDTNTAYELYGVTRPTDPTLFPNTSGVELPHTDGLWHAAQETVWNMNTNTFRTLGETSADAAGLSILAGLVRPDEGLPVSQGGQGAIDHALRVTLPSGDVNPQYIYPASHMVSTSQGANNLPLGGRLRLANTPAIDALIAAMPPESQIIATAMQQYGLIVADIGSAMYVTGSSATVDNVDSPNLDLTWNLNDIFASNGLEALNAGDFQVVNLTPVVTGLSGTSGSAGSTVTISGQNFSGAAGHLSVFFGTTAASSVTYVSDSQLTVVVPSGTGTVNVTVQSGVNETDNISDHPSANVNQPIFGYGTSAVSAADQFTYSSASQTISGANSTIGFASPTVVSGATDLLTIVVEDTTGKAVSSLASSAFSFKLSGGTSAGTFGTVTATATPGTYTASFTGTTAGTASTLTATVNGVTLTNLPTVMVSTGPVSATSTASFATGTVAAGNTDLLTVVVKDGAGNPISGLSSSSFSLALAGGASAGTFGAIAATTTPGTYAATFTGTTAGTASTLTATVSGVTLNTKPTVQVIAGGISSTNSKVGFASPTVASGGTDDVTIVVEDNAGNPVSGLASSAFGFALADGTSAGSFGPVEPTTTPGTYTALFTATTAGTASTLTATVSGVTLASAPTVQVSAGGISGANSTVTFASPTVVSGTTDVLTIVARDSTGNPVSGLASSAFGFKLSGGASAGTFGAVTATATAGTYTAVFTGTTAGTVTTLTATVSGVALTSQTTVTVTAGPVSATTSKASFAASTVAPGSTDLLTIAVKDAAGNPISGLASTAFSLALTGGTSAGTFGAVTATTTPGTYTATFTGTTAGTAGTLTATVSGVTLTSVPTLEVVVASYPPPMNLQATPGNGRVTFSFTPVTAPVSYYPYAQLINGTLYPIYVGFTNPFTITANNSGPLVNGKTYTFEVAITYASGHTSAWSSPVTVTVGGTTAAPTVGGVTPARGPATGGAMVTITGTNFTGATGVAFGSIPAAAFTVMSATQITATEPAGTAGQSVNITVTTPGGTSATTTADKFTFVAAPRITTQPVSATVTAGQPATFKVVASGDGLSYQWQKQIDSAWVSVSTSITSSFLGATTASFTITSSATGDAGTYRVVVSSAGGAVDSSAVTLTVNPAVAPTITKNPTNQTVAVGSTVKLTAKAAGSPTPSVQWQISTGGAFANIPGATSTTYTVIAAASENGDQFRAVFTNSAGQVITTAATLTTKSASPSA
jgi:hypothetical protein